MKTLSITCQFAAHRAVQSRTGLSVIVFVGWFLLALLVNGCKSNEQPAPNQPPVVKVAATTASGTLNSVMALDATGTTDPEGKVLTYKWSIKSQPAGSNATITNADKPVASFTPDKPGTYVLVLTVTDADGQSASTEITVTVAIPGSPPVANAGVSSTVTVNQRVTLNGTGSSDPDGDRLSYTWALKSKPAGSTATIGSANAATANFTPDVLGTYVCSLSVTDGNWPSVSADVTITAAVPTVRETTGKWTAADGTGGGNEYTPRNHFYTFDVATNNQPISLTLTSSDINVGFYIYDPNGDPVDRFGAGFGRNQTEEATVTAGKYTVMVCSGQRYDIGGYTLRGRGLNSAFTRVAALRELASDVTFGTEGGGGTDITSRNHYYTFDVTADNAFTDINVQSTDLTLWMRLYGPTGAQIDYTFVGKPRFLINKLNKGSYRLWVGSGNRDAIGKYTLDVLGQVQNLKQTVFDFATIADTYRGKNATTTYTLTVTEDNTILDATVRSPDETGRLEIINPSGVRQDWTFSGNYTYLISAASKGQYKIVVTNGGGAGTGKYTLSVYGKFTDLKKQ